MIADEILSFMRDEVRLHELGLPTGPKVRLCVIVLTEGVYVHMANTFILPMRFPGDTHVTNEADLFDGGIESLDVSKGLDQEEWSLEVGLSQARKHNCDLLFARKSGRLWLVLTGEELDPAEFCFPPADV